ncbi:MAG: hypothetical protein AAFR81_24565 [Chloroflexota bacterium]
MLKRFYTLAVLVSLGFVVIPFFVFVEFSDSYRWEADTGYFYWWMVACLVCLSFLSSIYTVREALREIGQGKRDAEHRESVWVRWRRLVKKIAWIGLGVVPIRFGVALASSQALYAGWQYDYGYLNLIRIIGILRPFFYIRSNSLRGIAEGNNGLEVYTPVVAIIWAISILCVFALLQTGLIVALILFTKKIRRKILVGISLYGMIIILGVLIAKSSLMIPMGCDYGACNCILRPRITYTLSSAGLGLADNGLGIATLISRQLVESNGEVGFYAYYGGRTEGYHIWVNPPYSFYLRQMMAAGLSWLMMGMITWGCLRVASQRVGENQKI